MKNLRNTSFIAFTVGIIVFIVERIITKRGLEESNGTLFSYFMIMQLYSFVITFGNVLLINYLNKFVTWESQPKKRLIIGSIISIILTMLIIIALRLVVVMLFFNGNFQDFLNTSSSYYIFSLIVTINILIIMHAIYFFKAMTDKKVTKHKTISKTQSAKFESLKNQLDPHFLFNSLNVLTSLIEENPKQAEKFTTKLSKIYRYVLTQKSEDLVLATEELKFAKTYTDLLKMRFEDAVIFNIPDKLENENLKIIPLALQLLLENAVKHNVITSDKKLEIKIYEENNYLIIENNVNPKSTLEKSTKVGLQNIIDRYALVTPSEVIIENDNKTFKVKLPLLIQKTKIMNTTYNKEEKYYSAKKKVEEIKGFYSSLIAYIFVIPFLAFIWYRFSSHSIQWFWFPAFGWGIGLVFQWINAFNRFPFLNKDWEKRKMQELMNEDDEVRF